jgi:hypothetical protein
VCLPGNANAAIGVGELGSYKDQKSADKCTGAAMKKTCKLDFEIVLSDDQQQKVMEVARRLYASNSATTEDDEGLVREISADEFIVCPSKALMSIVQEKHSF